MQEALNGKNIYIGVPTRGSIHITLARWISDFTRKPYQGYSFVVKFRSQDPTDCNRNAIVKEFLADPCNEWLLMLDDDMNPLCNLFDMINRGKKIISGLTCVFQDNRPMPLVMKYSNPEKTKFRLVTLQEIAGTDPLIEVDGIGAACLLVHREVLEKVKPPWFEFQKNDDGTLRMSEDYSFSNKVTDAGYKLYVDPEAVVGHMKWMDLMDVNSLLYSVQCSQKVKIEDLRNHGADKMIIPGCWIG